MWYTRPASEWEEALPVGNGRLGAMVFGGFEEERIQLNEESYWTGGPYTTVVEGGHKLFGRYLLGYPVEQDRSPLKPN